MASLSFFVIAVFAIISGFQVMASCPSDKDKPWSFDDSLENGPSHWADLFEECANHKIQSPINIKDKSVVQVDVNIQQFNDGTGLKMNNFDIPFTYIEVQNIGYTVQMTPKDGIERSVTFNGSTYPLKRFIVRFGEDAEMHGDALTTLGSDHRLNGEQMRAELQFIYGDKGGPENDKLILSTFLQEVLKGDGFLERILNEFALEKIDYEGDSYDNYLNTDDVGLSYVFFEPSFSFYAYKGSLSTPPCTPLIWLILEDFYIVNTNVLLALTKLHSVKKGDPNADKCYMKNNSRGPQPLDGRTVYKKLR